MIQIICLEKDMDKAIGLWAMPTWYFSINLYNVLFTFYSEGTQTLTVAKSFYISHALSYNYETEFDIWAGFGLGGNFRVHKFLVLWLEFISDLVK